MFQHHRVELERGLVDADKHRFVGVCRDQQRHLLDLQLVQVQPRRSQIHQR